MSAAEPLDVLSRPQVAEMAEVKGQLRRHADAVPSVC